MKKPKKTLLDLDRIPTLEELRAFFKENDWSAAAYMELDYNQLPDETVAFLEHARICWTSIGSRSPVKWV